MGQQDDSVGWTIESRFSPRGKLHDFSWILVVVLAALYLYMLWGVPYSGPRSPWWAAWGVLLITLALLLVWALIGTPEKPGNGIQLLVFTLSTAVWALLLTGTLAQGPALSWPEWCVLVLCPVVTAITLWGSYEKQPQLKALPDKERQRILDAIKGLGAAKDPAPASSKDPGTCNPEPTQQMGDLRSEQVKWIGQVAADHYKLLRDEANQYATRSLSILAFSGALVAILATSLRSANADMITSAQFGPVGAIGVAAVTCLGYAAVSCLNAITSMRANNDSEILLMAMEGQLSSQAAYYLDPDGRKPAPLARLEAYLEVRSMWYRRAVIGLTLATLLFVAALPSLGWALAMNASANGH
jgi:hypothetical protein